MSKELWISPVWEVFNYSQLSIGWRMGGGESYFHRWKEWFVQLSYKKQKEYIRQYPEPEGWFEFYHLCLTERDMQECAKVISKSKQLRKAYLEQQYTLALHDERCGKHECALQAFENIIICKTGAPIKDGTDVLIRYAKLKRYIAAEMALNPTNRQCWKALTSLGKRVNIEKDIFVLDAEKYARLSTGVFFPSDLGRTWIKFFENDVLYIHRHWQEPCVFLVEFSKQDADLYHIAEAWINPDPAIPPPLTRPPIEAPALLQELISNLLMWGKWGF